MEEETLNHIPYRKLNVVAQAVETELVLILPEHGKVKVLNESGSRIWEWIDGICTADEIAEKLHQEYRVELRQAQEDILDFLQELSEKGLIDWLKVSGGK